MNTDGLNDIAQAARDHFTAKHQAREMIDAAREGELPDPVKDL